MFGPFTRLIPSGGRGGTSAAGEADGESRLERRRHPRKVVHLQAEIVQPALGRVKAYTQDLSAGGAFVLVAPEHCPPVGSTVIIRLPGVLGSDAESVFNARVVRVTEQGMGLEFFDFDMT